MLWRADRKKKYLPTFRRIVQDWKPHVAEDTRNSRNVGNQTTIGNISEDLNIQTINNWRNKKKVPASYEDLWRSMIRFSAPAILAPGKQPSFTSLVEDWVDVNAGV